MVSSAKMSGNRPDSAQFGQITLHTRPKTAHLDGTRQKQPFFTRKTPFYPGFLKNLSSCVRQRTEPEEFAT
jgi:hypothetical protein